MRLPEVAGRHNGGRTLDRAIGCAAAHLLMIGRHTRFGTSHRAPGRGRREGGTRTRRQRQSDQYG